MLCVDSYECIIAILLWKLDAWCRDSFLPIVTKVVRSLVQRLNDIRVYKVAHICLLES
jgi:hypothetical protein